MRRLLLIPTFVAIPLFAQRQPTTHVLRGVFPGETNPEQFALSSDTRRAYYLNRAGEIWLYDHDRKANSRLITGNPWDLSLSPKGAAIVYTKGGDGNRARSRYVALPLALVKNTTLLGPNPASTCPLGSCTRSNTTPSRLTTS
jgi:hypothetical protein